jgi:hypothetical protein
MLKPWDTLTPDEKKLFIRQVEVFAAYGEPAGDRAHNGAAVAYHAEA